MAGLVLGTGVAYCLAHKEAPMAIASVLLDFDSTRRPQKTASITPEILALTTPSLGGGVFARMSPAAQQLVASRSSLRDVPRGAVLAAEGTAPGSVFVIVSGRVRAVRRGESGREITVDLFGAGDLLGDALVAPDQPLMNNWEAAEASTVLVIPRDVLTGELDRNADLAVTLCRQLLRRLNASQQLAVGLALSDVEGRVVAALLALGRQQAAAPAPGNAPSNTQQAAQPAAPEGDLVIRQRPTQQDLANRIGACRETVSRVISDLTRRGLLTPQGRGLLVSKRLAGGAA